jgi:hypothetical protein
MLSLWRRQVASCKPSQEKGRKHTACSCPIWCDGEVNGVRVRKSMDTRDWGAGEPQPRQDRGPVLWVAAMRTARL